MDWDQISFLLRLSKFEFEIKNPGQPGFFICYDLLEVALYFIKYHQHQYSQVFSYH